MHTCLQLARMALVGPSLIFAVLTVGLHDHMAFAQKGPKPLFPLAQSVGQVDVYVERTLRDPDIVETRRINSDFTADRAQADIFEAKNDLKRAKGSRRLGLVEQVMKDSVALSYYWGDAASGRIKTDYKASQLVNIQRKTNRDVAFYSGILAKETKDRDKKAQALFHLARQRYVNPKFRSQATKNFQKLRKAPLSDSIKDLMRFGILMQQLTTGGANDVRSAYRGLTQLLPKLSVDGQLAAYMSRAQVLAGLDGSGKKRRKASARYRKDLAAAAEITAGQEILEKRRLFRVLTGIWRRAEPRGSWLKPPFKLQDFQDVPERVGILERQALEHWASRRAEPALQGYFALSQIFNDRQQMVQVDERIADLKGVLYRSRNNPVDLQTYIVEMTKKYLNPDTLQGRQSKLRVDTLKRFRGRHKSLADRELKVALNPKTDSDRRYTSLEVAKLYLADKPSAAEVFRVRETMARIYVLDQQFSVAVSIYFELFKAARQDKDKRRYLNAAITAQRVMARWPKNPPWQTIPGGPANERQYLFTLYGEQIKLNKRAGFPVSAHQGLIEIALGRQKQGFALWQKAIRVQPKSSDAAEASGYMLLFYRQNKAWQDLEDLSRFALKAKIPARRLGKAIPLNSFLGLALYEGGMQHLAEARPQEAVKKLTEFTLNYKNFPQHDTALFHRALAEHQASMFARAIATLVQHTDMYRGSQWHKQALLNGGDWSVPMAYEESAITFFEKFLERFAKDSEAVRVRRTLVPLYKGRALFAEASKIMRALIEDPSVNVKERLSLSEEVMDLEDRQGEEETAVEAAQFIVSRKEASDGLRSRAMTLLVLAEKDRPDMQDLAKVEAQLRKYNVEQVNVRDSLAQIRLMLARQFAEDLQEKASKIYNLELQDPLETLNQFYSEFTRVRGAFQGVCKVGESAYCGPALFTLANATQDLIGNVEEIDLAQSRGDEVTRSFEARKAQILQELATIVATSQTSALVESAEGRTSQVWSEAIAWGSSSEVQVESEANATSGGYLQWEGFRAKRK